MMIFALILSSVLSAILAVCGMTFFGFGLLGAVAFYLTGSLVLTLGCAVLMFVRSQEVAFEPIPSSA